MRSDKMPTRREGEASSDTAVLTPSRKQENRLWLLKILATKKRAEKKKLKKINSSRARILRRKAACAFGNRGLWTAQTRPKQPRVWCMLWEGVALRLFVRVAFTGARPSGSELRGCHTSGSGIFACTRACKRVQSCALPPVPASYTLSLVAQLDFLSSW